MAVGVRVWDESSTGQRTKRFTLELVSDRITARELIRRRVQREMELCNSAADYTDQDPTIDLRPAPPADWHISADAAEESFRRNAFFLLVGDRQIESLDEELLIAPGTEVLFLRLVPLVGG
jgi:hypothetical protein